MPTFYGVNKTLSNTGTVNTIEPEMVGSKLKWFFDTYTFLTTEVADDVIRLMGNPLPAEARVVDWFIDHGDLANNRTLAFGTLADDDEFMVATDCGAGADKKNMIDDGVSLACGFEIAAGTGQTPTLTLEGGAAAAVAVRVGMLIATKG